MNSIKYYMAVLLTVQASCGVLIIASVEHDNKLLKKYRLGNDQEDGLQGTCSPRSQDKIKSARRQRSYPIVDDFPLGCLPQKNSIAEQQKYDSKKTLPVMPVYSVHIDNDLIQSECGQYWLQDVFFIRALPFVTKHRSLGDVMERVIRKDIELQKKKHRFFSSEECIEKKNIDTNKWLCYLYEYKDRVYKDCESKERSMSYCDFDCSYIVWPYIKEIHKVRKIVDSSWNISPQNISSDQKDL